MWFMYVDRVTAVGGSARIDPYPSEELGHWLIPRAKTNLPISHFVHVSSNEMQNLDVNMYNWSNPLTFV